MSGIEICEAEACWAEGWLQKTVTIATLERVQGPLTKDLTPDSFSTRVVELDSFAYGIIALQIAVVLIHELYALNKKPLLANHEKASSNWVQLTYLFNWFQMFFVTAMTVPVSLDFCMQLGQSAAMSGFYLSSPILGSIVGIVIGKMMTSEVEWNQPLARRLMIFAGLIQTVCGVGLAAVVNDAAHYGIGTRRTIFWIVILLMQVSTVIGSIPCVPMLVMQAKLTPTSEKTFWMILAQCARNAGMLVGPGFFAVVAFAVKQGQDVSPGSLLAWVYISWRRGFWCQKIQGEMMVGMTFCMYSAMALPTYIAPMTEDEVVAPETEVCVSVLEPPLRERVVKNMVLYSLERPFSIAAIEVGTIMLLEVSYGWSTELCGTAFTVVAGASLVFSAISSVLLSRKVMTESFVFFAANMCGLLGVLFLFDFGTGAAGLLIADGLVYGMASVANGIAEGWGTKAAMPGTGFSVEIYRLQNTIAVNSSRFVSPIVARTLLDFGGRNVYACLQLLVVFLGTMTVYKTVRLVWDHEGEAKPLNSNKAEKLQNDEITVSNT